MSHLWNPLVTAQQLEDSNANNALPAELQDSIRFYTARLTQAAGILLRLPQDIAAQAVVLLMRFWVVEGLMKYEFSDVSATSLYLIAKISASPRSLRSITNVYAYLLSQPTFPSSSPPSSTSSLGNSKIDPEAYYLSESAYITFRNRILALEGQLLYATGFTLTTHISLPHPLAITYAQALDLFSAAYASNTGTRVAQAAIRYLNTALLSPQMLYLTHQPNALAVAALYMAAREEGVKLPAGEWWQVFDVEREELGFLCLGMGSLGEWVSAQRGIWGDRAVLMRKDITREMEKKGNGIGEGTEGRDEEEEMGRLLDVRGA